MSINLGDTFTAEADHLDGLRAHRDVLVGRRVPWGIGFLDDCFGGIYPDDLLLVGAGTGVGKTALAVHVARSAASAGIDPVYFFALEAEPGEISARLAFGELARLTKNTEMDFSGWWRGKYKAEEAEHWGAVQKALKPDLKRIRSLYKRRGDFTTGTLAKHLEGIASQAKMVILDHIHVMDIGSHETENTAYQKTVRLLRDFVIDTNVPVIVFSQVRKKQHGERGLLMPDLDDLYGASRIKNDATGAVIVARDWDGDRNERHHSPTLFRVAKDRRGRASPLVARVTYDMSLSQYEKQYSLGRVGWDKDARGQKWELMDGKYLPYWAANEARMTERDLF